MSFLSSIAPALGGIGQGVTQGLNALNQQEQQKFQKEQQDRMRQAWADQDATNTALKGIQTTTQGAGVNGSRIWADDNGNVMPGATAPVARPTQDILADQARVYLNSTDPKNKALGLQLQQNASALGKEAERNAILAEHKSQFAQLQNDPFAWGDTHGTTYYNAKVPDGQKVTQSEILPNGSRLYHVLDNNNKLLESHEVTPDQAREVAARALNTQIMHKLGSVSNEDYWKAQTATMEGRKVGAQEKAADAGMMNAETQSNFHKEGGVYQQISQAANAAHIRAAEIARSAHGMMNQLQEAQLKELTSFADLADTFQKQLSDPNTPPKELRKTASLLAVHPSGKALNTVMVHDAETGTTSPVTVNKFEHLVDQHQKENGHFELNPQDHTKLQNEAALSKGNQAVFLKSPFVQQAISKGIPPQLLIDEFLTKQAK
jgi:hypothetical protein